MAGPKPLLTQFGIPLIIEWRAVYTRSTGAVGFLPEDKFGIHDLVSPKLLWLWWDNVDPLCDAGQGGGSVGSARNVGPSVVSLKIQT